MKLLVLLALAASGPTIAPDSKRVQDTSDTRPRLLSFGGAAVDPIHPVFEFATASGTGMSAACACTVVTGTRGEVMTFTRASSGTCLTGNWQSSIANGSMVTCANNLPRVMPGGDGTGVRGLLVESARTNAFLRSQEIDNPAWSKDNIGCSVTVTADQAVAPDGTTTADRLQLGAGNECAVFQQTNAGATVSVGTFIKGNGTSGSIDIGVFTSGGTYSCASCAFNATTWTRCSFPSVATNAATPSTIFGNWNGNGAGCVSSAAKDIFIWGAQNEVGPFSTSYIPTTSAAVTRAAETDTFSVAFTDATGSFFATGVAPASFIDGDHGVAALSSAGPSYVHLLDARSATSQFTFYSVAGGGVTVNAAFVANVPSRAGGFWSDVNNVTALFDANGATGVWTASGASTLVEVGLYSGAQQFNGVIKSVCLDTSSTRCR